MHFILAIMFVLVTWSLNKVDWSKKQEQTCSSERYSILSLWNYTKPCGKTRDNGQII